MYAGHAALALAAKAKRPSIAIAVLVPIAWAPDWIEYILTWFGRTDRMLSHSIVSVAVGATVVALIYLAVTRIAVDAAVVWLTYASHWPADYVTGTKPTWPHGPWVGLLLYAHPTADFYLESGLVLVCSFLYWRSLPAASRRRVIAVLVPAALIALQAAFNTLNGRADLL